MSIIVSDCDPAELLTKIKQYIDEGHIITWKYDSKGNFWHTTNQWKNTASFSPQFTESGKLAFTLVMMNNKTLTNEIYGMLHGDLTAMLLVHFSSEFKIVGCSSS